MLCLRDCFWLRLLQMLVTVPQVFRDGSMPWRSILSISGLCQNNLLSLRIWALDTRAPSIKQTAWGRGIHKL